MIRIESLRLFRDLQTPSAPRGLAALVRRGAMEMGRHPCDGPTRAAIKVPVAKSRANPLKTPDSDEGIQEKPRKTKEIQKANPRKLDEFEGNPGKSKGIQTPAVSSQPSLRVRQRRKRSPDEKGRPRKPPPLSA